MMETLIYSCLTLCWIGSAAAHSCYLLSHSRSSRWKYARLSLVLPVVSVLSSGMATAELIFERLLKEPNEGLAFLRVMLGLAQSLCFAAVLLLTMKGWSAVRQAGLHKQEARTGTGLTAFCGMGDLIALAGLGEGGADGRPVLVQAVFRGTLLVYGGQATWRAWWRVSRLLSVLQRQQQHEQQQQSAADQRRDRVSRQLQLLTGNLCLLTIMMVYHLGAWMAAAWWPEWRLLSLVLVDVPVGMLYAYILICIKLDLL